MRETCKDCGEWCDGSRLCPDCASDRMAEAEWKYEHYKALESAERHNANG